MNLVERSDKVISRVLSHFTKLEVVKGKGAYLFDKKGHKYLDFASGIAVTNTGHCHPQVVQAAAAQLKRLIHNSAGVTYLETPIKLAEVLQKIVPIKDARFFLTQSGSEAVEGCLKAAKYFTKRSGIIALKQGFHGRTMGALSVTSSKKLYTDGYGELMPNTFFADFDIEAVKRLNNGNIAAVIAELVRGEGGYIAHDQKFIRDLRDYCTTTGILLIIDEVQSGFGRTGKMFTCEWYGIEPDLVALAKGIASGFPLGAVVMKKEISERWQTSAHGGTFTGNPVACAAALATINILKKELPKMGKKIKLMDKALDGLIAAYPKIFERRQGLGFMQGLKCPDKDKCTSLRELALAKGLLLISSGADGDVVRLAPPVTITTAELQKGFNLLASAAAEMR